MIFLIQLIYNKGGEVSWRLNTWVFCLFYHFCLLLVIRRWIQRNM